MVRLFKFREGPSESSVFHDILRFVYFIHFQSCIIPTYFLSLKEPHSNDWIFKFWENRYAMTLYSIIFLSICDILYMKTRQYLVIYHESLKDENPNTSLQSKDAFDFKIPPPHWRKGWLLNILVNKRHMEWHLILKIIIHPLTSDQWWSSSAWIRIPWLIRWSFY